MISFAEFLNCRVIGLLEPDRLGLLLKHDLPSDAYGKVTTIRPDAVGLLPRDLGHAPQSRTSGEN